MVRSELAQKLCNTHPQILRKDIEKVFNPDWQKLPKFASFTPSNGWDLE